MQSSNSSNDDDNNDNNDNNDGIDGIATYVIESAIMLFTMNEQMNE